MPTSTEVLSSSEAAASLGVTAKALRVYEDRGLVRPLRNAKGWRYYGSTELARARDIVALRTLGLSLSDVARVLDGDSATLQFALENHQQTLEERARTLARTVGQLRHLRVALANGKNPAVAELTRLTTPPPLLSLSFALPWPWGGEPFDLRSMRARTFVTGPLGSGKTRLAKRIAQALPDGAFSSADRVAAAGGATCRIAPTDAAHQQRIDWALAWLIGEGAKPSDALRALLVELEGQSSAGLVVDMLEEGLDAPTQHAVMSYLRLARRNKAPLIFTTRSSAILDLSAIGPDETIIYCPANHSPPLLVDPHPAAPGYEAVAMCLASPDVRARTAGVVATRRNVA